MKAVHPLSPLSFKPRKSYLGFLSSKLAEQSEKRAGRSWQALCRAGQDRASKSASQKRLWRQVGERTSWLLENLEKTWKFSTQRTTSCLLPGIMLGKDWS